MNQYMINLWGHMHLTVSMTEDEAGDGREARNLAAAALNTIFSSHWPSPTAGHAAPSSQPPLAPTRWARHIRRRSVGADTSIKD